MQQQEDDACTYIPDELDGVAKKDDDMTVDVFDANLGQHIINVSDKVFYDMQDGCDASGVSLKDVNNDANGGFTLPFIRDAFEETLEQRPLAVEVDVIYLMYLANAMFMGAMMLCMGTFWMYVFELLPCVGPFAWVRHVTTGVTWGAFISLYAVLGLVHVNNITQAIVVVLAWQLSAVFAVASLAVLTQHQAPLHVCAIDFLQSVMVVVYVYGQKTHVSASIAFLLMLMITLLQWSVATFVLAPVRHSMLSSILVLVVGILISVYHAFHIRYITQYNISHYHLGDMSRLEAIRDLYTDGPRWLGYGIHVVHLRISQWRRALISRLCFCNTTATNTTTK